MIYLKDDFDHFLLTDLPRMKKWIKIERVWEKNILHFFDDITTVLWLRHNVSLITSQQSFDYVITFRIIQLISLVRRLTKYFKRPKYFFEVFVSFSKIQGMFFADLKLKDKWLIHLNENQSQEKIIIITIKTFT